MILNHFKGVTREALENMSDAEVYSLNLVEKIERALIINGYTDHNKINQELYRSIYIEERFIKDGKKFGRGMIIARPATGEDFSRACETLSGDDEKTIKTLTDFGGVLLEETEARTSPSGRVTWREDWIETRQSLDYGRGLKRYSGEAYEIK